MATNVKFNDRQLNTMSREVRAAFQKGRKTVEIGGYKFKLRLLVKFVAHTVADGFGHNHPKKVIRQREEWILAERADGKLAPRLCVERTPGKNSAVKR